LAGLIEGFTFRLSGMAIPLQGMAIRTAESSFPAVGTTIREVEMAIRLHEL
jgi:hypothetical protein